MSSSDDSSVPIENIQNKLSRDSESNIYGEDFYLNPLTNPEYTKTLQEFNVDKFLYDIATDTTKIKDSKALVSSARSLPFLYEGQNVVTDTFIAQNLSIDALKGMDAPQYYAEPGYLISFMLAVNDPLMSLKVYVKGLADTGYSIADYTMQKMTVLGLGMTQGEAEEIIYTTEGQTSRDMSGHPSTEYPYIQRYKHLPTGTETDYEKYKGTNDDAWIVAVYNPKNYPKFNSLFFDVFNGNPTGSRLIHYLEIKRLIIIQDKQFQDIPQYSHSILSLANPQNIVNDILQQQTGQQPEPGTQAVKSNYAPVKLRKIKKNPIFRNPDKSSIYSIDKEQQGNKLFNDIMDVNHEMFNEYMAKRFQKKTKLT